jgi:hypothetical protein
MAIEIKQCAACGRALAVDVNVCPYCGYDYSTGQCPETNKPAVQKRDKFALFAAWAKLIQAVFGLLATLACATPLIVIIVMILWGSGHSSQNTADPSPTDGEQQYQQAPTQVSPQLADYASSVSKGTGDLAEGIRMLKVANDELANDHELINSQAWTIKTAAGIVLMQHGAKKIEEIDSVPPEAEKLHRINLQIAYEAQAASGGYANAIDNVSAPEMHEAFGHMARLSELMVEATNEGHRLLAGESQ